MPELPEVESVRRLFERRIVGKPITGLFVEDDSIVVQESREVEALLAGKVVVGTGRRGKTFWLVTGEGATVGMHLGMSGWVRDAQNESRRLVSHGSAPLNDALGNPKFLKMAIETTDACLVFTDPRRFARIWVSAGPSLDPRITRLGRDALLDPPSTDDLKNLFAKKTAPIKAALLDQTLFAGVGNWIADEVCYHARVAPARLCRSLSAGEIQSLVDSLAYVLTTAVDVDADADRFPANWLFSHRWGGKYGSQEIEGRAIVRETVAGRTTAWVPSLQS